jgi:hypothetical protein
MWLPSEMSPERSMLCDPNDFGSAPSGQSASTKEPLDSGILLVHLAAPRPCSCCRGLLQGKTESRPEQVRAVPAEISDVPGRLAVPELRGLVPAYLPPYRTAEVTNWK